MTTAQEPRILVGMFSILHITDLHRAKSDPISNAELVSALISDREYFDRETPPIRQPDAIVVSGDIIQGVALGAADFKADIAAQYDTAHDFLVEVTDRFLDGDRSKVVIIPGNHDIDWNTAFAAMEEVAEAETPNLPAALHEPESPFRWNWKTRRLYRISDPELYRMRFAPFWEFFERFYSGTSGLLRVDAWADANLFSFDQGRIGVVAFNSCAGNDCFAFHGRIPPEVVAQSHMDLKDAGPWRLRIAVWHHDIEGPPHRTDYMDPEIVRGMIGRGFRLGLYGHQHRTQVTPQHAYLPDRETMAIASAGSLCAGHNELPTGARRGYSVVVIGDDYLSAQVHVREMVFANSFSRAHLNDFGGCSYVDLEWTEPVDAGGRAEDPIAETRAAVLAEAEDALQSRNDPAEALRLLSGVEWGDPFSRRLAIEAATRIGPSDVIRIIGDPTSIEELILLFDAMMSAGDLPGAAEMLTAHGGPLSLPENLEHDLRTKLELRSWNS